MSKTRESGFYWCKYRGDYKVCEWEKSGEWWNIPGLNNNTIFEDQSGYRKTNER